MLRLSMQREGFFFSCLNMDAFSVGCLEWISCLLSYKTHNAVCVWMDGEFFPWWWGEGKVVTLIPPFLSPPCPAYCFSLFFGVKSVLSEPSALVFCSCSPACFALLLLLALELQRGTTSALTMHCSWAIEEADQKVPGVTCCVCQTVVFSQALPHFSFLFIMKQQTPVMA